MMRARGVPHRAAALVRDPNEFQTSYPPASLREALRAGAPGRPEIIYCEQCYNTEVA